MKTEKELNKFIMNVNNSRYEVKKAARQLFDLLAAKDGGKRKWYYTGSELKKLTKNNY